MSLNRLLTRAAQNQDEPEDIVDFVRQRLDFYPDEKQIRRAIAGNTCRCTGYQNIFKAIEAAAESLGGSYQGG